jgi:hypothetical protein
MVVLTQLKSLETYMIRDSVSMVIQMMLQVTVQPTLLMVTMQLQLTDVS